MPDVTQNDTTQEEPQGGSIAWQMFMAAQEASGDADSGSDSSGDSTGAATSSSQNLDNWDRQYRFMAGKSEAEGFEIGATSPEQPVPIHCSFSIDKSDTTTCNTATVSLWNLSPEHLAALEEKDCACTLRAGYGDRLNLIFTGVISHATTSQDGGDMKTEIELLDNLTQMRDTYVTLAYDGKVNWKTILDDVGSQMGVAVSYSYNAEFTDVENGYSYVGKASTVLDKGCDCCGLSWSIQSGVLQVKKTGDTMDQQVYVLSPDTGLLGIPAEVVVEEDTDLGMKVKGWDVEYFLNAAINVDDFVKVESKAVTGFFRVYSVKIEGDSAGGDWKCQARLLQITLDADNPAQQIYALAEAKAASKSSSSKSSSSKKSDSDSSKDKDDEKDKETDKDKEKEEKEDKGDEEESSKKSAASISSNLSAVEIARARARYARR